MGGMATILLTLPSRHIGSILLLVLIINPIAMSIVGAGQQPLKHMGRLVRIDNAAPLIITKNTSNIPRRNRPPKTGTAAILSLPELDTRKIPFYPRPIAP